MDCLCKKSEQGTTEVDTVENRIGNVELAITELSEKLAKKLANLNTTNLSTNQRMFSQGKRLEALEKFTDSEVVKGVNVNFSRIYSALTEMDNRLRQLVISTDTRLGALEKTAVALPTTYETCFSGLDTCAVDYTHRLDPNLELEPLRVCPQLNRFGVLNGRDSTFIQVVVEEWKRQLGFIDTEASADYRLYVLFYKTVTGPTLTCNINAWRAFRMFDLAEVVAVPVALTDTELFQFEDDGYNQICIGTVLRISPVIMRQLSIANFNDELEMLATKVWKELINRMITGGLFK